MFEPGMIDMYLGGVVETLYMTLASTLLAYVLGLPLGVLLVTSEKQGIHPMPVCNKILNIVINILRSVPFLILLITIMPFTRFLIGTTIGATAMVVPLVVSAAPYVARLVESSLREVDRGVVEAAQSMGSSTMQIVMKVLLPEAVPSLITGAAIACTTILGYSAMAGIVGGGGLGGISINYGYYRQQTDIMLVTVVLLVLVVQIIQWVGDKLASVCDKRKH